jgi:flavin reductase (DIM6/NTAB) family NADH-FMN oxidoreductase RutF
LQSHSEEAFKALMRAYPQAVTVTTTSRAGKLHGVTVSSFVSVSIKPLLVLISIAKGTPSHAALTKSEGFVVNVLSSEQSEISERFAGRAGHSDKFVGVKYTIGPDGSPVLDGCVGHLECKRWETFDAGDHTLILGEVTKAARTGHLIPLVYYDRRYTTVIIPAAEEPSYESLLGAW